MTPSATHILKNPHPQGHIVYPYTTENEVAEAICLFAGAGLRKGEAALLVMTAAHRQMVSQRLEEDGIEVDQMGSSGQLVFADAKQVLDGFMFDGIIDELKFKTKIGSMIASAKANNGDRPVRVFGEMVDLISVTNPRGTQRLEELWNEVIAAHSVPLLCAYCLSGSRPTLSPALLACHSDQLA